jgi:hypothetical protein
MSDVAPVPPASDPVAADPSVALPTSQNFPKPPNRNDSGDDNGLSLKQLNAIDSLLGGLAFGLAAEKAGVSRRTLYEWRHHDPQFQDELRKRRRMLWEGNIDRLRALLPNAISIVERDMRDRYDDARFRAASTLLRLANVRAAIPVDEPEQ